MDSGKKMKVLLIALCFVVHSISGSLLIDKIRDEFLIVEDDIWKRVLYRNESHELIVKDINEHLEDFNDIYFDSFPINSHHLYDRLNNKSGFNEFYEKFIHLDKLFDTYKVRIHLYDKKKVDEFVNEALFEENNVLEIFDYLSSYLTTIFIRDRFSLRHEKDCDYTISNSQQFYYMYNIFAAAYLKCYMIEQYAYIMKELQSTDASQLDISLKKRTKFEKFTAELIGLWSVKEHSSQLRRCEPINYIEDENFGKITGLLQGHIENEADLNSKRSCTNTCPFYQADVKTYGCYDSSNNFCRYRKKCNGKLYDCQNIGQDIKTCLSSNKGRVDYFENEWDIYGKRRECFTISTNSWTRWFVRCDYCFCLCDEQGPLSDRYFNLRPVVSQVNLNKIVTGIRLVKSNRIIHFQIQEADLLPFGFVNEKSVKWQPIENYQITDSFVEDNVDYFTLNRDKRTIFLDKLETNSANEVITGIQFSLYGPYLTYTLYITPFVFETGELLTNATYKTQLIHDPPVVHKIHDAEIPTLSTESNVVMYDIKAVEFTHSGIKKDAAQHTVPFIDFQSVVTTPAAPLKGVGLYYKKQEGYGGFISPSVYTYEYKKNAEIKKFPKISSRIDVYNTLPDLV